MFLRFFNTKSDSAFNNMAADETLAETLIQDHTQNFIRFYTWNSATLSFGYNQKIESVISIPEAEKNGVSVVKRMSGGRMVLHDNELTFCVGLHDSIIKNNTTFLDKFLSILQPLVKTLNQFGLKAEFASINSRSSSYINSRSSSYTNSYHCYFAPGAHSVFVDSKKFIGAAAIYRNGCLIVHGSMPVKSSSINSKIFIKPFLKPCSAYLNDYINSDLLSRLPEEIAFNYAQDFSLQLKPGVLEPKESLSIKKLAENKYSNPYWQAKTLLSFSKAKPEPNNKC